MAARLIRKLTLIFLMMAVAAAGFCGFFLKWSFRDDAPQFGFTAIMENTSVKPFIYRQLIPQTVKAVSAAVPEPAKEKLSASLKERRHIDSRFARAEIPPRYVVEYYLMFALSFLIFFAAIWILRALLTEVAQDSVAGTIGAMLFALIFPFFEVLGGYYYDLGEVFFFFTAALLAVRGKIFALLLITPLATLNKESFLFFLATLFPLIRLHFDAKKSAAVILGAMFLAGLSYLGVREIFSANVGGAADWRLTEHFENILNLGSYFQTDAIYGLPLGARFFLPYVLCVAWLVKSSWRNLSAAWKFHAKLALAINGVLYFLFVVPGELRDLSMLYVTLMILAASYLRESFRRHYKNFEEQQS
ncbi:MAG: hypothetical protein J5809_08615 [Selenomonadaceae bacterium]|nr:hypothetical protein [Selenomonadaceae bacterium]